MACVRSHSCPTNRFTWSNCGHFGRSKKRWPFPSDMQRGFLSWAFSWIEGYNVWSGEYSVNIEAIVDWLLIFRISEAMTIKTASNWTPSRHQYMRALSAYIRLRGTDTFLWEWNSLDARQVSQVQCSTTKLIEVWLYYLFDVKPLLYTGLKTTLAMNFFDFD